MNKRFFVGLSLGLLVTFNLWAKVIVDWYGDTPKQSKIMLARYAKVIASEEVNLKKIANQPPGKPVDELQKNTALEKRRHLMSRIKQSGNYAYVNFTNIFYPGNPNHYITVEVVRQDNPDRLRFVNEEASVSNTKHDLIQEMIDFSELQGELMLNHGAGVHIPVCPVYHCILGFEHPQLKPYLKKFNQGVIKHRQLILKTLQEDKDPARRAAAVFLMGHFHDPREIIDLLLPAMNDSSDWVRNNVMRVLASTIEKSGIRNINATPFIEALDSPYTTDRNKALLVLDAGVDAKDFRQQVTQLGAKRLVNLLRLKQPNNHDLAYVILKKISGQSYAASNFTAWQQWASHQLIG